MYKLAIYFLPVLFFPKSNDIKSKVFLRRLDRKKYLDWKSYNIVCPILAHSVDINRYLVVALESAAFLLVLTNNAHYQTK